MSCSYSATHGRRSTRQIADLDHPVPEIRGGARGFDVKERERNLAQLLEERKRHQKQQKDHRGDAEESSVGVFFS